MSNSVVSRFLVKHADKDWAEHLVETAMPSVEGEARSGWSPIDWPYGLMGRTVPGQAAVGGLTAHTAARENAEKAQTMRTVANLGLLGLGVGAGGAGLYNAGHWLFADDPVGEEHYGTPTPDEIHYPQTPEQAHSPQQQKLLHQRGLHESGHHKSGHHKSAEDKLTDSLPITAPPESTDKPVTSVWSYPWAIPSAGLSLFLGGLGGASLTNWLARSRRKKDVESELGESKEEYEKTLLQQYDPRRIHQLSTPFRPKMAAESTPDGPLDKLHQLYREKRAGTWEEWIRSLTGTGMGAYGLAALAAGIPAGVIGYQLAAKSDSRKVMEDALKQRLRLRAAVSPLEMGFETAPVAVHPGHLRPYDPDASEDESPGEEPPPKAKKRGG